MESSRDIKKRIKSVSNTAQITKAMEAVSATKMRKSQEFALAARPYAAASLEMMKNLLARTASLPSLLATRPIKNSALLVVTSDKGLAGAFNSGVIKKAEVWIEAKKKELASFVLITVGKKAKEYFERRKFKIIKSFWGFGDFSELAETLKVSEFILQGFAAGTFDEVDAAYTHFRTTLKQETFLKKILPATEQNIEDIVKEILPEWGRFAEAKIEEKRPKYFYEYKFEPSAAEVLNSLVPQLLKMHLHHVILESNASEHSARMVAMKNASDSAEDIIDNLNLVYNKARQAGITRELTEITAGADALEK